jgi:hypothetical protein
MSQGKRKHAKIVRNNEELTTLEKMNNNVPKKKMKWFFKVFLFCLARLASFVFSEE